MSRVVLTGVTGLVGGAIFNALQNADIPVLAILRDVNDPRLPPTKTTTEFLAYNMQQPSQDLSVYIHDFAPDVMIHAGWIGSNNQQRNDAALLQINIQASMELLSTFQKAGGKHFINFGSQAEYSDGLSNAISEDAPCNPSSAYGQAKQALCESQYAFCSEHDMRFVWLRLFTCYGRGMHPSYLIPYLVSCFARGETPQLKTPHAIGDYLHVNDMADAVMAVLRRKEAEGIYNLASGTGVSVEELAIMMAEYFPDFDATELRKLLESPAQEVPLSRVADITLFKKAFGWKPSISLSEGLHLTLGK